MYPLYTTSLFYIIGIAITNNKSHRRVYNLRCNSALICLTRVQSLICPSLSIYDYYGTYSRPPTACMTSMVLVSQSITVSLTNVHTCTRLAARLNETDGSNVSNG